MNRLTSLGLKSFVGAGVMSFGVSQSPYAKDVTKDIKVPSFTSSEFKPFAVDAFAKASSFIELTKEAYTRRQAFCQKKLEVVTKANDTLTTAMDDLDKALSQTRAKVEDVSKRAKVKEWGTIFDRNKVYWSGAQADCQDLTEKCKAARKALENTDVSLDKKAMTIALLSAEAEAEGLTDTADLAIKSTRGIAIGTGVVLTATAIGVGLFCYRAFESAPGPMEITDGFTGKKTEKVPFSLRRDEYVSPSVDKSAKADTAKIIQEAFENGKLRSPLKSVEAKDINEKSKDEQWAENLLKKLNELDMNAFKEACQKYGGGKESTKEFFHARPVDTSTHYTSIAPRSYEGNGLYDLYGGGDQHLGGVAVKEGFIPKGPSPSTLPTDLTGYNYWDQ